MTLSADSKYPARRTYVLKLQADASALEIAGRLENLATGRQLPFRSAGELVAALAADLLSPGSDRKTTVR